METPSPEQSRDFSEPERRVLEMIAQHLQPALQGCEYPEGQRVSMTCEALLAGSAMLLARAEWIVVVGGTELGHPASLIADTVEAAERRVILNARRWAQQVEI